MKLNVTDEQLGILNIFLTGELAQKISVPIANMEAVLDLKDQISNLQQEKKKKDK